MDTTASQLTLPTRHHVNPRPTASTAVSLAQSNPLLSAKRRAPAPKHGAAGSLSSEQLSLDFSTNQRITNTADPEVLAHFERGLHLVRPIAARVQRALKMQTDLEDLESYGRTGLFHAARRFNSDLGIPFGKFARYRIRGAILDEVRARFSLPRRTHRRLQSSCDLAQNTNAGGTLQSSECSPPGETPEKTKQLLEGHLATMTAAISTGLLGATATDESGGFTVFDSNDSPEEHALKNEVLTMLTTGISALPEPQRSLLGRHYLNGERLDHIGQALGLSKTSSCRQHQRGLQRLTTNMRDALAA